MKKITNMMLIMMLLTVSFAVPESVRAKTVGDLKSELKVLIDEMNENKEEQELTEAQIKTTEQAVVSTTKEIETTQIEIQELALEIEQLNADIDAKDEEIKSIINYFQIASGEEAYLEYTFGAADFEDFIYRMAVSEQLSNYNDELINQFNDMIETNKKNQDDLVVKQTSLETKQVKLEADIRKLENSLDGFQDISISIEEDIKLAQDAIKLYQDELGCADEDDIKVCGRNKLPPGTALWRPTDSGKVTSEYNLQRYLELFGQIRPHYGTDIGESGTVPIYAAGNGMVIATSYKNSCGGNMIYVHHNIKGVNYTTAYLHLRSILVTKGDVVDKNTQIALMGGSPAVEYWDKCSTGQHLHFQLATGHIYKDYYTYSSFSARSFNSRLMINYPSTSSRYTDRLTQY